MCMYSVHHLISEPERKNQKEKIYIVKDERIVQYMLNDKAFYMVKFFS